MQNFLYISSGSARELAFQLSIAAELQFGEAKSLNIVADKIDHVERMLIRLIDSVERKRNDADRASKRRHRQSDTA